jgi:hypothetical protein
MKAFTNFARIGNAKKAARAGKPIMWPAKPQDQPCGAEESVDVLVVWVEITLYAVCSGMLGLTMEICKKVIVPYIVVSENTYWQVCGRHGNRWMVWIVQQRGPRSPAVTATKRLGNLNLNISFPAACSPTSAIQRKSKRPLQSRSKDHRMG